MKAALCKEVERLHSIELDKQTQPLPKKTITHDHNIQVDTKDYRPTQICSLPLFSPGLFEHGTQYIVLSSQTITSFKHTSRNKLILILVSRHIPLQHYCILENYYKEIRNLMFYLGGGGW